MGLAGVASSIVLSHASYGYRFAAWTHAGGGNRKATPRPRAPHGIEGVEERSTERRCHA